MDEVVAGYCPREINALFCPVFYRLIPVFNLSLYFDNAYNIALEGVIEVRMLKNYVLGKMGLAALLVISLCMVSLAGCASSDESAAVYKNGSISKKEHDKYLSIMKFYTPGFDNKLKLADGRKEALLEHIAVKVLAERGRSVVKDNQTNLAKQQWEQFKSFYETSFSYNGVSLEQQLKDLMINEQDLLRYIEDKIYGSLYLKNIPSDTLEADFKLNKENHNFEFATINQIFISPLPASLPARTQEETLASANEVFAKLTNGEDFAQLAKEYSDDIVTKDTGGLYSNMAFYDMDAAVKKAVIDLPLHEISKPLLSNNEGYYIVRVDAKGIKTDEEALEELKSSYVQTAYLTFMTDELPDIVVHLNALDASNEKL